MAKLNIKSKSTKPYFDSMQSTPITNASNSFKEMKIMTPPTQGFVFARLGDDMVEHLWKMIRRA